MYSLAVLLLVAPIIADAKSVCEGLVWKVDGRLNRCLAMHCSKAGKDEHTYIDIGTCKDRLLRDFFKCGGGVKLGTMCEVPEKMKSVPLSGIKATSVIPVTGSPSRNTRRGGVPPVCPAGESCHWGPFGYGYCCEDKNQEVWYSDYAAKCASPMKTVNITQNEGKGEVLRGKSCKDIFCPAKSKCIQGTYLAHCCTYEELGDDVTSSPFIAAN